MKVEKDVTKKSDAKKRVILMVLDSLGVGELPDAEQFGDAGANTFGHIVDCVPDIAIPNLRKLGFGNVPGAAAGRLAVENPLGRCMRLAECSAGKDTITGHWEIAGIHTMIPFKTYPDGFPKDFIKEFEEAIGRKTLGNYAASGTVIIEELGEEHEKTGAPIVYTSADSVFQIAANTEVIPLTELYHICEVARKLLVGDWACGRVIARPYVKKDGKRERTSDRHDYAVAPPEKTMLDNISEAGLTVAAVGKINDIFDGKGITETVHTDNNMDGVNKTLEFMNGTDTVKAVENGLIFTNLVDFDSKYGHRRDPEGYANAIMEFDDRLPEILSAMKDEDLLMLCADHGNDPVHSGWDHTREYIPLVIFGKAMAGGVSADRDTFSDIGATICDYLGAKATSKGQSFLSEIE